MVYSIINEGSALKPNVFMSEIDIDEWLSQGSAGDILLFNGAIESDLAEYILKSAKNRWIKTVLCYRDMLPERILLLFDWVVLNKSDAEYITSQKLGKDIQNALAAAYFSRYGIDKIAIFISKRKTLISIDKVIRYHKIDNLNSLLKLIAEMEKGQ